LKEKGGPLGFEAWRNSLKFKMSSFRHTLLEAGVTETTTNGKRKSRYNSDGIPPAKNIKKARRSEATYLPSPPNTSTSTILLENVKIMQDEIIKTHKDIRIISTNMEKTFAERRKEIVGVNPSPLIADILLRWPALFIETQVSSIIIVNIIF